MTMRFVLIACLLWYSLPAYTQSLVGADECIAGKMQHYRHSAKPTVASPEENKYDVQHVHLDIAMDNQSVAISGKATTRALVLENNFSLYVFELNKLLTIDSVLINRQQTEYWKVSLTILF